MRYLGGKTRIAKHIAAEIDKVRRPGQMVWDAFCGGLSVSRALLKKGPVLATDACTALISLYRAVQNGWQPPIEVTEAEWRSAKLLPDTDPMKAFCAFGCSFSGDWAGGYAKPVPGKTSPSYTANTLKRDVVGLDFDIIDFMLEKPRKLNSILYLDPPYAGTAGYAATGPFDSELFYELAKEWGSINHVFVSECKFPYGEVVWSAPLTCNASGGWKNEKVRVEKLFYVGPKLK